MVNNFYKIFIYLDYSALPDIFLKGDSKKARINAWLNRFSKFNL